MTVFYLLNKNFPPPCGRGKSLFSMIQVEVAILMELLALFDTLSVLAVGRVKLVMQMVSFSVFPPRTRSASFFNI